MNNEAAILIGENGTELVIASELSYPVQNQQSLNESSPAVKRIANLTSDFLKGAISLPNKTIEIAFKPEIQKGLNDSIYRLMTTKQGETLADAINVSTGGIIGKGRIVETGKAKQLIGGAFQLVSIAVAQSHLSDINSSLNRIQGSLDKVLEKMEAIERSEIRGAIAYLHELVEFMKHQENLESLPSAKRMKLEDINYDFKKWRESSFSEMSSVLNKIHCQKDIDTFGTGDTYLALKQHVEDAHILNQRYELLLELASMFNFLAAYLDPQRKQFSRVDPKIAEWVTLIDNTERSSQAKVVALLKSATFNQEETLMLRRQNIISEVEKQKTLTLIQQKTYHDQVTQLSTQLNRLLNDQGEMRLAITFDSTGTAKTVAMLPA